MGGWEKPAGKTRWTSRIWGVARAGRRGAGRGGILTLSALDQGSTRLRVGRGKERGRASGAVRRSRARARDAETAAKGPFRQGPKGGEARFRSHRQTVRTFCTAPTVAVIMACGVERKLLFVRRAVGAYLEQGDGEVDGIHVVHDPRARGGVAEGHDNLLAQERLMREGRRGGERPGGRRWKFPAAGKSKSGKGGDAPRPPPLRRRERRSFAARRLVSP